MLNEAEPAAAVRVCRDELQIEARDARQEHHDDEQPPDPVEEKYAVDRPGDEQEPQSCESQTLATRAHGPPLDLVHVSEIAKRQDRLQDGECHDAEQGDAGVEQAAARLNDYCERRAL